MRRTTPRLSRSWRAGAAALVAAVLTLSGCTSSASMSDDSGDQTSATPSATPSGSGDTGGHQETDGPLAKYYDQDVSWQSCGSGFECAEVTVPVDYTKPGGDTLKLKMRKRPADDAADSLGSLFVNPGGPGGSGVNYVKYFASEVSSTIISRYDVIGFDPRGVGQSTPITCLSDTALDKFVNTDPDPDTKAEARQYAAAAHKLGEACKKNTPGDLAAHVSTIEVAKDLDILRAVVGDEKLAYVGASYGTAIGATYAQLFPHKVGRFVLDGALDPELSNKQANMGQAKGFHTALVAYIEDCLKQPSCPVGSSKKQALNKLSTLLQSLDKHPLPSGDPDRPVTEAIGFYAIVVTLYRKDTWPLLTQELKDAFNGDGSTMLYLADQYLSRTDNGYKDNSAEVIYAVNCLDDPVHTTIAKVRASQKEYTKVAPVFGATFAWSPLTCSEWPMKPSYKPLTIHASGAAPIVVVGTTRDPATPYKWAVSLSKELDSGVLITRDGDGHTGYNMGNACVDDAVNAYLLKDKVPKNGLRC